VGYYRETSVIPRYMARVFADRREERQRLLRARSNTIIGQAIDDVIGPADLVGGEVTRDTGPGGPPSLTPASLTPRSVTPRPATPRPATPRPAPPRRGWQVFFGVLCLLALGAAGGFLWYTSPSPEVAPAREPEPAAAPEPEPEPAVAPEPAAAPAVPDPQPAEQAPERRAAKVKPVALAAPDAGAASAKTAQELYDEGTALFVQGKAEQAKQKFKEAVELDPAHAASYKGLGLAYQAQGKDEKAARAFEKYLSLDPKAADAASIKERIAQLRQ
jgi:hypothetical protein